MVTDKCDFDVIREINGGIVVPATVCGLKKGLAQILENQNELRHMGENLGRYVKSHYGWNSMVQRYCELYERILVS